LTVLKIFKTGKNLFFGHSDPVKMKEKFIAHQIIGTRGITG